MHLKSSWKVVTLAESQKLLSTLLIYPAETISDSEARSCGLVFNFQLFCGHHL